MFKEQKHIKQLPELSAETREMISGSYIGWGKSKEQVWASLEKRLEPIQPARTKVIAGPWIKLAIAATITLLVGISIFMQFYTKTIRVAAGQHSSIYLPDHSRVRLNAQSTLSYEPLKWKFSRIVRFEGEAFFEVEQGKKFEVISTNGKTLVMGTSFNVYSRNSDYQVTCVSGKVKVIENKTNKEVLIQPGQKTELRAEGILEIQSGINAEQTLAWLNNKLTFTSVALPRVFEEIGRQYGVLIHFPGDLDNLYTGSFKRNISVEHALNLVCKPFNLKFIRKSNDEYIISGSN